MEECDPAVLKAKVEKAKTILYKVRKYLTPPGWEVKLITWKLKTFLTLYKY